MINRKVFIFAFLFLILILPLTSAAKPQTNVNLNLGYEITYPKQEVIESDVNYTFNFHVFNKSDGLRLDNTTINCSFHLYDHNGSHLVVNENILYEATDKDWEILVEGANFSKTGQYDALVNCESPTYGGFVSYSIEVTPTGKAFDDSQGLVILGLLAMLLFIAWVFLYFGLKIEYLPFKIFLISMGALTILFTVGMSINLIKDLMMVGIVLAASFVSFYRLMLILISAGGIGLIVYIIYMSVKQFWKTRGKVDDDD